MAERHTLKLTKANLLKALKGVQAAVRKGVDAGKPWTLELRERTRTDDQNDALHGLISQIMKKRPVHNGIKLTKEEWKATLMQALGREMKMLPTLDGDGFFPMGLSTSRLTVTEFSNLIEFTLAWCAREGIEVEHFDDGQGTGEGKTNLAREAA